MSNNSQTKPIRAGESHISISLSGSDILMSDGDMKNKSYEIYEEKKDDHEIDEWDETNETNER